LAEKKKEIIGVAKAVDSTGKKFTRDEVGEDSLKRLQVNAIVPAVF
jgi:hypothetical protein